MIIPTGQVNSSVTCGVVMNSVVHLAFTSWDWLVFCAGLMLTRLVSYKFRLDFFFAGCGLVSFCIFPQFLWRHGLQVLEVFLPIQRNFGWSWSKLGVFQTGHIVWSPSHPRFCCQGVTEGAPPHAEATSLVLKRLPPRCTTAILMQVLDTICASRCLGPQLCRLHIAIVFCINTYRATVLEILMKSIGQQLM